MNEPQSSSSYLQIQALVSIQEIDLKIDQLKKKRDSLPAQLAQVQSQLQVALKARAIQTAKLDEIEKTRKQIQAATSLNEDRLKRSQEKLEGVTNAQEYQAASKEIDQLKKAKLGYEEQTAKFNPEYEAATQKLAELNEEVTKIQAELDQQTQTMGGEKSELDSQIQQLESGKAPYISKVEVRIYRQYDRVRGARAGLGIVPLNGSRCTGCNMAVPPQLYNEILRARSIEQCPNCQRVVFSNTH